jgi:hypothetical protein
LGKRIWADKITAKVSACLSDFWGFRLNASLASSKYSWSWIPLTKNFKRGGAEKFLRGVVIDGRNGKIILGGGAKRVRENFFQGEERRQVKSVKAKIQQR